MDTTSPSKTRAEAVYAQLRSSLLRGDHPPGSKLRISELAERYGVSPSVLREVLSRLSQQGLVVANPQRGFAVPELTTEGLQDLMVARVLVETTALRESVAEGDLDWESSVIGAHHSLQQTHQTDGGGHLTDTWARAHRRFHHVLLAGGRSQTLTDVATGLRDRSDLYVHWSRELARDETRDVAAEHRLITEKAIARDVEGAATALREHIERSASALIAYATGLAPLHEARGA